MAIRRPPTTFSDTISTTDIADDAISGDKLANDIAISTTGNIATTGSGTLTVAGNTTLSGTNNLGSNPTITLGTNAIFPAGNVINLEIKQYGTTAAETLGTTDAYIAGMEFSYAVKEQTSKLYVAAYPLLATEHDGNNYSHKFSLRSSVDSYGSTLGNGNVPQIVHYGDTAQGQWLQYPTLISCLHDHNQTAGTTITYRIYGQTKSNTKGIYIWDSWSHTGGPSTSQHAVIYEIAQ